MSDLKIKDVVIGIDNGYGNTKSENTITFDANHEMAGKELNFHIELVEVVDG